MGGIFWFEMASSVTVDATTERAFEVVERTVDWPRWSTVVEGVDRAPEIPWQPGAELSFRLRMAGRVVGFNVRVTGYGPARKLAWASTRYSITAVRTLSFEPVGRGDNGVAAANSTLITDHKRFSSPLLPVGIAYPRGIIRRMTEQWLADVKAEVERGRTEGAPAAQS